MATYLDFEEPIKELEDQIIKMQGIEESTDVDLSDKITELEDKLTKKTKEVFSELTPWQKVQLSRHPDRPYTLAYIEAITDGEFQEFHGDRNVKDDKAMVGGFGLLDGETVMFIGQQKGVNTKMRQYRNFGMPNPEGYRKALRLMKMAEKFGKPIVTLIDTPGAFPGLEAEERGQGEAIARNIYEMMRLTVPVICIVIGEGASGGALGIGVGDRVNMMENTWYSVISPESCSSILCATASTPHLDLPKPVPAIILPVKPALAQAFRAFLCSWSFVLITLVITCISISLLFFLSPSHSSHLRVPLILSREARILYP